MGYILSKKKKCQLGYTLIYCFYVVIILFNLFTNTLFLGLAELSLGVWAIIVYRTSSAQSWLWRSQNLPQQTINFLFVCLFFFFLVGGFICLPLLIAVIWSFLYHLVNKVFFFSFLFSWWFCHCIFINLLSNAFSGICLILLSLSGEFPKWEWKSWEEEGSMVSWGNKQWLLCN